MLSRNVFLQNMLWSPFEWMQRHPVCDYPPVMSVRAWSRVVAAVLLAIPGDGVLAICSGGPPRQAPPRRGPAGNGYPVGDSPTSPSRRYEVGDYSAWWQANRDDILLTVKAPAEDPLEAYAKAGRASAPPDSVETLLGLLGYEGDFCTLVREIGLRRLRRNPRAGEALVAVLKDANALPQFRAWAACALGELEYRQAGTAEVTRLLNRNAPPNFKLPISP